MTDRTKIPAAQAGATPAEELRAAATKLREMAEGTTGAPWLQADCTVYPRWIVGTPPDVDYAPDVARVYDEGEDALQVGDADWRWMAFAHPGLAEPLADWLEEEARQYDGPPCDDPTGVCNRCEHQPGVIYALAVARQINGGEPR